MAYNYVDEAYYYWRATNIIIIIIIPKLPYWTLHTYFGNTNVKYKTFITGNCNTWATNCSHGIAATLHTLETWFVPGI